MTHQSIISLVNLELINQACCATGPGIPTTVKYGDEYGRVIHVAHGPLFLLDHPAA